MNRITKELETAFFDLIDIPGVDARPRASARRGRGGFADAVREITSPTNTGPELMRAADAAFEHVRRATAKRTGRDPGKAGLQPFRSAFVRENVRLIQGLGTAARDRMTLAIDDALERGITGPALRERLQEGFGMPRARADLIAQDQILKAAAQLSEQNHKAVGVTEYIWTASGDERVRDDHAALDGTRHSYDRPPVVDQRTGRRAHPGEDFQCRCTAYPVLPEDPFA